MVVGEPAAVLFACNLNRVRSPMAAAILRARRGATIWVDSCGVAAAGGGEPDPFAQAAMREAGLELPPGAGKSFADLGDGSFDLVVSLTSEAQARAARLARGRAMRIEHWPIDDPTLATGSRDTVLAAYRAVRDDLARRIAARFGG